MLISIRVPEASELLWSLYRLIPEDRRNEVRSDVDKMASFLDPPSPLDCVVFTVGGNGACKPPV